MSKPVNVTNMDFGISNVDWIVELLSQGIIQGKDPRPGLHIDAGPEAQREISHKFIRQGLLVISPVNKQEDAGIPLKEEPGLNVLGSHFLSKHFLIMYCYLCLTVADVIVENM